MQETSISLPFLKWEFEGCTINHITCLFEGENKPQFHIFQYMTSLFNSCLVVVWLLWMSCVENFLFHIESWIDSHTFELFSVPQDRSLHILVVLVVEIYIFVLFFAFYFLRRCHEIRIKAFL